VEVHSAVLHIFWYSHLDPATVHENLHWRRLLRPCLGPRALAARRLNANAARSSLIRFSSAQFKDLRFALQALGERASDARRSAGFFPLIAFKRRHRCPKHGLKRNKNTRNHVFEFPDFSTTMQAKHKHPRLRQLKYLDIPEATKFHNRFHGS